MITASYLPFLLRWHTSACRNCCRCSNTQCRSCTRSLSFTRRSWRAATLTPASRLCLWTKPMCKCLLMLLWAFSGNNRVVCDLVQEEFLWILSHYEFFLHPTARTCSTVLWSLTRLLWLDAVSPRLWLSSSLAVSSLGCHGKLKQKQIPPHVSLEQFLPSFLIGGCTRRHSSGLFISAFSYNHVCLFQIILYLLIFCLSSPQSLIFVINPQSLFRSGSAAHNKPQL